MCRESFSYKWVAKAPRHLACPQLQYIFAFCVPWLFLPSVIIVISTQFMPDGKTSFLNISIGDGLGAAEMGWGLQRWAGGCNQLNWTEGDLIPANFSERATAFTESSNSSIWLELHDCLTKRKWLLLCKNN